MMIKSSTKDYNVNIYRDFGVIRDMKIDERSFVVIDKVLYEIYKDELFHTVPEGKLSLIHI